MSTVAIIGTGFIGRAWAISFARAGHDVALWDEDARRLGSGDRVHRRCACPDLPAMISSRVRRPRRSRRLRIERDLAAALSGAEHVQENAPERVDVKQALFAELDRLAPQDAVIASSTSAILPSRFTESLAGRHRCLIIASDQPALSRPGGRDRARALDVAGGRGAGARFPRRGRPGADRDEA